MVNNKKLYMVVCMMILSISIVASLGTYAWYVWNTDSETETKIVTSLGTATIFYDAGKDIIDGTLAPVATKEEGMVKTITVSASKDTTYKISFNLYLDIVSLDEGLKHESFRYQLYQGDTLKKEGNFTQEYLDANLVSCETNNTNHIVLISDETITTTEITYTLYIWIDGANYDNPNTMQNQNLSFKLHADGENAVLGQRYSMVDTISNLYDNASKEAVTNNTIAYNYAAIYDTDDDSTTSGGLINDRLGNTEVGANDGNIRYYGKDPNNYIYFNCSDYDNPTSTTCETWRIIGLFKDVELADGSKQDLVKIARSSTIGNYAWDNKPSGTGSSSSSYGSNAWTDARLMMLLNDGYEDTSDVYSYEGSLYWNAKSGTCYSGSNNATVACDFTSTGLKNDETRNMIAEVVWNLGGWNSSSVYSDQMYGYERGETVYGDRLKEWEGRIALMYPSDYGYATDFTQCTSALGSYSTSGCYNNDWLYNSSAAQWTLTPNSGDSVGAWNVHDVGVVYVGNVFFGLGVRPVLYLDSELDVLSGNGSKDYPYIVR